MRDFRHFEKKTIIQVLEQVKKEWGTPACRVLMKHDSFLEEVIERLQVATGLDRESLQVVLSELR